VDGRTRGIRRGLARFFASSFSRATEKPPLIRSQTIHPHARHERRGPRSCPTEIGDDHNRPPLQPIHPRPGDQPHEEHADELRGPRDRDLEGARVGDGDGREGQRIASHERPEDRVVPAAHSRPKSRFAQIDGRAIRAQGTCRVVVPSRSGSGDARHAIRQPHDQSIVRVGGRRVGLLGVDGRYPQAPVRSVGPSDRTPRRWGWRPSLPPGSDHLSGA
jgi:hypothetical protein